MVSAEYEPVLKAIHDTYLYMTGGEFDASERKRVIGNYDKVHAALALGTPAPLSIELLRNKVSTLEAVYEIFSQGDSPPDVSLLAFQRFVKNYKLLTSPEG